ncbi:conserved hypothetical protein [Rubrivivax sp. A210]|uniref:DUF1631 family protein n=1 Tax=Rubrivivax sp. A210 TaxID=2772301 RepID=UPI001917D20E|nr:DUF1631 family protein [Rubrivivax sp. A210]CAD5369246.1 conserved hypothetical protein [Rubrivivax sp. A210]
MKPNPVHRLPPPLEAAVQRIKLAAREAAERTIESLGLAALAAGSVYLRDGLLGAQFELNRKSAVFVLTFNDAFDERVLREVGPRAATATTTGGKAPPYASAPAPRHTNWDSLSLVDDREVEAQISAERFGMEIAYACEWELRELDAYVGALLVDAGGESERNPVRPDIVGHAMLRGIESVSDRPDVHKVLSSEMSRSLGALLPAVYASIVADWRNAGVQPAGLAVRNRPSREYARDTGREDGFDPERSSASRYGALPADSRMGGRQTSGFVPATVYGGGRGGTQLGQVDPALMSVIRRLAHVGPAYGGSGSSGGSGTQGGRAAEAGAMAGGGQGWVEEDDYYGGGGAPLPNLIRAHREELRQASRGGVDHMVIDVIGFLFDQILADPKVPPQMARQIARLQLPVLRAALGDSSFFSTRKHPVRRFINRIASLGAGFEDFSDEAARQLLAKVRELVQQVVEGDFDRIEIYEQKLLALEQFVNEQALQGGNDSGGEDAATVLSEKEDEIRLRQLYAQRLAGDLKDVEIPDFLRDFVSGVWSQVLMQANSQGGADGPLAQRLRRVGRELFLSVQAKPTPAHRKAFLAELPRLMQDLTEGMNLIAWPEAQRREFFGRLMPAHADALKRAGARQLDINLMARRVEGAFEKPLPSREELRAIPATPLAADEAAQARFTPEEARRIGLVDEAAVDWNGQVDIPLGDAADGAEQAEAGPRIAALPVAPGLPAPTEAPEATQGHGLAENVEVGFAYEMHLNNEWHKVRLAHISPGRAFFMFTYGGRHRKTVSLTQRMLIRLCDTGRMRAFEQAALLERATARARRQLAALGQAQAAG